MKPKSAVVKKIAVTTTLAGTFLSLPSLVSAHFGKELLYLGKHNEHVKNLQKVLKNEGYYKLSKPTGYFGAATEKAVKSFQKAHGLDVDGLVGPKTKAELYQYVHYEGNLLKKGSHGEQVKDAQEHLKELGYYKGHLDGNYGPLTRLAVLRFQKVNHLKLDGIIGPETFKVLHSASPKKAIKREMEVANKSEHRRIQQTSRSLVSATTVMYVSATAYTAYCPGCSGTTATGIDLRAHPDAKVVAVDPNIIPLGTKLYIEGYGYAVAGDTGGAIKGKHIDLFMPSREDALKWGRRTVKVTILGS
jgi:3D (Asp-Asp-Asp) domain-containing protein